MTYLFFGNTAIGGTIPDGIGQNFTKLTDLSLASTQMVGTIPENIYNLVGLRHVTFGGAGLNGSSYLSPNLICSNQILLMYANFSNLIENRKSRQYGLTEHSWIQYDRDDPNGAWDYSKYYHRDIFKSLSQRNGASVAFRKQKIGFNRSFIESASFWTAP
jgi:hypothetical protein